MATKTVKDVLDKIYAIINVPAITVLLDGDVHRKKRPLDSDLNDIVINCLPLSPLGIFQTCDVNINAFVNNIESEDDLGIPDEIKIDSIEKAINAALEGFTIADGEYFDIVIRWQVNDVANPGEATGFSEKQTMSNTRVIIQIENNK